ncbi:hypothetical protein T440DRAFT_216080 [Plenodomus tracheiphilus IPT5]|uniref:SET domain-containing protein n=1 Tax=Plenodomus tracheiphilus IPT5 TaxID=1408161 RepID=A0A6A7AUP7_9PLEO|nr:hypothetical protein T440DRAFT_216080 [Plenodomus tracheiphilus IPT5]
MTEVSSVQAHAEPQPASLALFNAPPAPPSLSNGSPAPLHGPIEEEESSTIKCICGFAEDDGNTVLCEKCNTWQHIVCYYEIAAQVPEVHECTDCLPRPIDSRGASEKQRQRRELLVGEKKARSKSIVKNPKKRTKDPLGSVQPNGWPVQSNNDLHYNPERKSGSPRDQAPPNKRPKTGHRTSNSVSVISQAPALAPASRKRGASVMLNGHSPVKSPTNPDGPVEDFSVEFMNLYTQAEVPSPEGNSYTRIDVANDMATWLTDPDALAEASGGKKPQDLFSRINTTIQELEEKTAPPIVKGIDIDSGIVAHGRHPQWHFITVEGPVADGGYIGELKGLIGHRSDYIEDPANRWGLLRHPEPFVFFPPHLPIYIDTRQEGSILRYARRSCKPNMCMKIFVETSNEYHFCFLATREINPGEELTVGWDVDAEVTKQLGKFVTNGAKEGFKRILPWVYCVLANFGGCACDPASTGLECLLERARHYTFTEPGKTKSKKSKKALVSPVSTGHATNSRAGSESHNRDVDDDEMDVRSTSGSHKSSSRDITPATHFSVDGEPKMSEREKRKIQQQEKLFEKIDFDGQHKSKKAKRNSAGSTLNTPTLSASKRIGHPDPSPSARHREHSHGVARKTSGSSTRTNGRFAPRPKPVYKEASTQTEDDQIAQPQVPVQPREMKPPLSFKRRLLQQAQEDKLQRERIRSASVKTEARSPTLKDVSSNKPSPLPPSPPLEEPSAMDITTDTVPDSRHRELTPAKEPTPPPTAEVDMSEPERASSPRPQEPKTEEMPDAPVLEVTSRASPPPIQPPAPPWSASTPAEPSPECTSGVAQKLVDLHVDLPAKFDMNSPSNNRALTPGSSSAIVTEGSIAQSPNIKSPFSPAVANAVKPTPARKKLSLSDYTKSRAKLAQTYSTGSASTPPLASQATSSPTLSVASLPGSTHSPPPKAAEPALTPVAEDAKAIETTAPATTVSASTPI